MARYAAVSEQKNEVYTCDSMQSAVGQFVGKRGNLVYENLADIMSLCHQSMAVKG